MSRTPGASIRRPVLLLLLALSAALALGLAANADAAPKQVPCTPIGGGKHNCSWRVAGNGKTGGSPVLDSNGKRVGFLHQGTNYITCQARGRTERSGKYFNSAWGRTVADNRKAGWVNAVWASGGDNDGGFSGAPACKKGHPPLKGRTTAPPAPQPEATVNDECAGAVKEDQTISARYTYTYIKRQVIAPGNVATAPTSRIEQGPDKHRFGTVRIIGGTCHTKKGWRPLRNSTVFTTSDGLYQDGGGNAAVKGKNSQKGWGLGPSRIGPGLVDIQMTYCSRDDSLGRFVDFLEAIPVPGLKYVYSVAKAAGTYLFGKKFRPAADTKCGDMGSNRIAMYADKRGRLRARISNLSFGGVDIRQDVRPGDPSQYYQQTKDPDTPRPTYGR